MVLISIARCKCVTALCHLIQIYHSHQSDIPFSNMEFSAKGYEQMILISIRQTDTFWQLYVYSSQPETATLSSHQYLSYAVHRLSLRYSLLIKHTYPYLSAPDKPACCNRHSSSGPQPERRGVGDEMDMQIAKTSRQGDPRALERAWEAGIASWERRGVGNETDVHRDGVIGKNHICTSLRINQKPQICL
jgi:hypothetical protein